MSSIDMQAFCEALAAARNVVVLTGAGVSAESGIPTFRGAGGFWRRYQAQNLATPGAFKANPSLVWEFYHYRREIALSKSPNPGHIAISNLQSKFNTAGRKVTIITQNIDELHQRAGAQEVIELHGSLFKTRCIKCKSVQPNYSSPICEALRGRGAPELNTKLADIPQELLPRCNERSCKGLLRPHIVWFGENLESTILQSADNVLSNCDMCLVVGTSSVVYPAAKYAPELADRGVPVAEFNLETTQATDRFSFHFGGPCGTTLPKVIRALEELL